ncbi:B12-binding domain-containing radical SAM protein [Candidatus Omnitrophota bacterium]
MREKSKSLNILLINSFLMPLNELQPLLSQESDLRVPVFTLPQGVLSLAAYARKKNPHFQFKILDFNKELHLFFNGDKKVTTLQAFIFDTLNHLDFKPDVVGVSVNFSTGHTSSFFIADAVKKKWFEATVVFGGTHVTNFTHRIIEHPCVDYVIRGSAEKSFDEFLTRLSNGDELSEISGCEPIKDLNELPMLAYDLIDMEYYIEKGGRTHRSKTVRSMPYQFSRGCCFHCTFCVGATVHGHKVISKNNDIILQELSHLKEKYKVNSIIAEDDLFGFHKKNFYDLCDKLEHLDLKLQFPSAFSVRVLDEPMIDRLHEIGIEAAVLAIESGSPYVQKNIINKKIDLSKAISLSKKFRSKGTLIAGYFIFGFPGETIEMMNETVEFAKKLELDWADFLIAMPLMGSKMCNEWMESGVLTEEMMLGIMDGTDFRKRRFNTPEIGAKDLETFAYNANIDVNFVNNYNMINGNYDRAIVMLSNYVIDKYPFHIVALACRAKCYHEKGDAKAAKRDIEQIGKMIKTHQESKRMNRLYGEKIDSYRYRDET